jgi:hypothetical protein
MPNLTRSETSIDEIRRQVSIDIYPNPLCQKRKTLNDNAPAIQ